MKLKNCDVIATVCEHYNGKDSHKPYSDFKEDIPFKNYSYEIKRKGRNERLLCYEIISDAEEKKHYIANSYFVGVDWIDGTGKAIYVEPKLNKAADQTNYLEMLFSALRHPEVLKETDDLFEIKWAEKEIEITQEQDHLTPLLVLQFIKIVQDIVHKGLKKSYYKVENNLYCKIKGKVNVSKTIKHNHSKNKILHNHCSYDEFGFNGVENRIIKKALVFVQRYLPSFANLNFCVNMGSAFNYINSAFSSVTADVELHEIKTAKINPFYKEYIEAVRLARLILKRFGYNINNTTQTTIKTPPFWIDMSKLFELYVLGLLKDRFWSEVEYHYSKHGNELDYLLNSGDYKMVVDAKYKTYGTKNIDIDDIRQVSGYARLSDVYEKLNIEENELIDCLIIYPDQNNGNKDLMEVSLKQHSLKHYKRIYKLAVELPIINK